MLMEECLLWIYGGGSYVLSEIHPSSNGVTINVDFENKKFIITVPDNAATNLIIFRLK